MILRPFARIVRKEQIIMIMVQIYNQNDPKCPNKGKRVNRELGENGCFLDTYQVRKQSEAYLEKTAERYNNQMDELEAKKAEAVKSGDATAIELAQKAITDAIYERKKLAMGYTYKVQTEDPCPAWFLRTHNKA